MATRSTTSPSTSSILSWLVKVSFRQRLQPRLECLLAACDNGVTRLGQTVKLVFFAEIDDGSGADCGAGQIGLDIADDLIADAHIGANDFHQSLIQLAFDHELLNWNYEPSS